MFTKNLKKGFSLVELLVVITIIAILSVTAYVALGGQTIKARNSKRMQDLATIQSAMEIYFIENGSYPNFSTLTDYNTFDTTTVTGLDKKYLPKPALDPWGIPYAYGVSGTGKQYQLAATIESEDENDDTAYVIGNYSGTTTPSLIQIDGDYITDGTVPAPYEKPAPTP